jgi:uncharacterized protein YcbX
LRVGDAVSEAVQLRERCIMTTYDPDSLRQDRSVLKRIIEELAGTMALDCAVRRVGLIREGDPVEVLGAAGRGRIKSPAENGIQRPMLLRNRSTWRSS